MSAPTVHAPRTVTVEGRTVAVQEYGDGEPLLVINGTSQSLGFWAMSAPVLAGRCRVVTWDLPGLGDSERGTGEMTVRSLADGARALLDELGIERAHVLGYSLGSAVAQELAQDHPARVARGRMGVSSSDREESFSQEPFGVFSQSSQPVASSQ